MIAFKGKCICIINQRLYHEIDLFSKGHITYWEMYNHFEEIE